MNRSAQSPFDPETFLPHARKVSPISRETEDIICGLVAESIDRYLENWGETLERERKRLSKIMEGLNTALAAILPRHGHSRTTNPRLSMTRPCIRMVIC